MSGTASTTSTAVPVAPSRARTALPHGTSAAGAVVLVVLGVLSAALSRQLGVAAVLLVAAVVAVPLVMLFRPRLTPALVALAIPVGLVRVPGPIPLQVVEIAAVATIGFAALRRELRGGHPIVVAPALWWALALTLAVTLSALTAIDRRAGMLQALQLLAGVALAATLSVTVRSLDDVRSLVRVAVFVGAAVCATTLTGAGELRTSFGGGYATHRAVGIFGSPNDFGNFAAMTFVLACGLALGARAGRDRVLTLLAVAVIGAGLILSLSRGAWLGGAVGVLVLTALLPRMRRRLVAAAVVVALLGVGAAAVAPAGGSVDAIRQRLLSAFSEGGGNPYDVRPDILRLAPGMALDHPMLGVGPGSFKDAFESQFYDSYPDTTLHAHNLLLTVAVEAGFIAAALLAALGVHLFVVCVRSVRWLRGRGDRDGAALVAALGAALVALAAHGLLDFTLRNAVLALFAWWVVGVLVAADRVRTQAMDQTGSST